MKTRFSNSQEVAHIWAQQNQNNGRCSNMFFEGTRIFSYGYHFCIANFVQPNVVLFTNRDYSNTTSKHKLHTRRALLDSVKVFTVPSVGWSRHDFNNTVNHKENLEYYHLTIKNTLFDAKNSRTRTACLVGNAESWKLQAINYCETFKLGKREINKLAKINCQPPELLVKIEQQKERADKKEQIEREKRQAKEKEIRDIVLPAWLNGFNTVTHNEVTVSTSHVTKLYNSYLRVEDEQVITSHGARVSLKAAKVLFDLIHSGKDVKGFDIDGYTVISMNGVLTVGCHKIERDEIYRFAKTQNWV